MATDLDKYREQLASFEQRAQAIFDRTVIALSGGALGVSFALIDKFRAGAPPRSLGFLMAAWAAWTLSLTAVLLSHYFGTLAVRKALGQASSGTLYTERVGGRFDVAVVWLNGVGALLFVVGVAPMGVFVWLNAR